MIPEQFKKALKEISSKLDYNLYPWALIGSTNLALQGMNTTPKDLDLIMELDNLVVANEVFRKYGPAITELLPNTDDEAWNAKLRRHPASNVCFSIKEIEIQILGERSDGDYVSKLIAHRLIYTNLGGFKIPCFTLEAEAEVYDIFRPEKAQKIRDFLRVK